jgi:hypothetical protein
VLDSPLGARLGGWLGQYRIRYHVVPEGAAVPTWAADPVVGLRLPPVGDNAEPLRSLTWQLHTYGGKAVRPDVPGWVDGPVDLGPDPRGVLRPDRMFLVRPDGFVAASLPVRDGVVDAPTLEAALAAYELVR